MRPAPSWGVVVPTLGRPSLRVLLEPDGVRGRLRYELRATWLGGTTILDKLEAADYDMFTTRPRLTKADAPRILWRTMVW